MTDALAAAILTGVVLTIVSTFGGAWVLSGRMSRVEAKLDAMDSNMDGRITGAVQAHQLNCPGFRSPGRAEPRTNPRGIAAIQD